MASTKRARDDGGSAHASAGGRKKDSRPEAVDPLPDLSVESIIASDDHFHQYARHFYKYAAPPCQEADGCSRNCKDSSNCLYGLGEMKKGIWAKVPPALKELQDSSPEWHMRSEGEYCGLTNLGATCYMNSLLQTLFMNTPFRQGVFSWSNEGSSSDGSSTADVAITEHLQRLFANLQELRSSQYNPKHFTDSLNIATGIQQDVQEFNKLLLQLLERRFAKSSIANVRDLVQNQFRGFYKYTTRCSTCGQFSPSSSDRASFYELNLNIQGIEDLESSLSRFLDKEILEGENQYLCDRCGCKRDAERAIQLVELPQVLNFQLMRFVYDTKSWQRKKLTDKFAFPESIDMANHVHEAATDVGPLKYKLTAVLIHLGSSATSGHYIAHIRDERTDKWYKFDDDTVTAIQGEGFRTDPDAIKAAPAPSAADMPTSPLRPNDATVSIESPAKGAKGRGRGRPDSSGLSKKSSEKQSDKEKGSKQSKEKTCESTGAYMLVYTREGRELVEKPVAPERLQAEINARNAELQKEMDIHKRKLAALESHIARRKEAYTRLWQNARVGPDEDACWVPTAWLRSWIIGEKDPAKEMTTRIPLLELTCEHSPAGGGAAIRKQKQEEEERAAAPTSAATDAAEKAGTINLDEEDSYMQTDPVGDKDHPITIEGGAMLTCSTSAEPLPGNHFLDPARAGCDAKRINSAVWREWEREFGSDIPELGQDSLCRECVRRLITVHRSASGRDRLKRELIAALEKNHQEPDPGFLIPQKFFRSLRTSQNPKIPDNMNDGLVCSCQNKQLRKSAFQASCVISVSAWQILKQLYPNTSEFYYKAPICGSCGEAEAKASNELESQRDLRTEEKKLLEALFRAASSNKVVPLRLDTMRVGDKREYKILPTSWIAAWQLYIQQAHISRPAPPEMDQFLCEHGHLMYDLDWTSKFGDPFQMQEALKDKLQLIPAANWEELSRRHNGFSREKAVTLTVECLAGQPAVSQRTHKRTPPVQQAYTSTRPRRASTRAVGAPANDSDHDAVMEGQKIDISSQSDQSQASTSLRADLQPFAVMQVPPVCQTCLQRREGQDKEKALSYTGVDILVKPVYPGSSLEDELRKGNDLRPPTDAVACLPSSFVSSRPRRQHGRVKVSGVNAGDSVEEFRRKIAGSLSQWRDPRRMKLYREGGFEIPAEDGMTLRLSEVLPSELIYVVIDAVEAPSSGSGVQEVEHGFKGSALVDLCSPKGARPVLDDASGDGPDLIIKEKKECRDEQPPQPIPLIDAEDDDAAKSDLSQLPSASEGGEPSRCSESSQVPSTEKDAELARQLQDEEELKPTQSADFKLAQKLQADEDAAGAAPQRTKERGDQSSEDGRNESDSDYDPKADGPKRKRGGSTSGTRGASRGRPAQRSKRKKG